MGCCRVCKGTLTSESGRERCQNPNCWTNLFIEGSIVKSHRHPDYGPGKVAAMSADAARANVVYDNGLSGWESCRDLYHHELRVGTPVRLADGTGVVSSSEVRPGSRGFSYSVSIGNESRAVDEQGILGLARISAADLAGMGRFDAPSDFLLRLLALHFRLAQAGDDMLCVYNSRVELMKHQVLVAHRAVQEHNPRYLLADEVGLGKTMEAGLIMKEMKARRLADRVLVIVPSTLVPQWVSEMGNKFNENFAVYDSAKVRECRAERPGENPWSAGSNIITSLQYARKENVRDEITDEHWDLVIFDEAHHLRRKLEGREVRMTKAFRLAESLRDDCGSMLLLTATPLQLQSYEFYSLLELIDPGRFRDYNQFELYRQQAMPQLNSAMKLLIGIGKRAPTQGERAEFETFVKTLLWLRGNIPTTPSVGKPSIEGWQGRFDSADWRQGILRELAEYQVVSRYMMRNRKADVFPGGPRRKAVTIQLELTDEEKRAYDLVSAYVRRGYNKALQDRNNALGFVMMIFQKLLTSSKAALISAFGNRIERLKDAESVPTDDLEDDIEDFDMLEETQQDELLARLYSMRSFGDEIAVLGELCGVLTKIERDTKAEQLVGSIDTILEKNPAEKILVFTQFHATQEFLRSELSSKYRVVVFNGRMSQEEKEAAIEAFRESAQVMVSTEAGGEGRNFQFAHIMFNYDLPWNPMKLEQRIGRLDRIGQRKIVNVYNFSYGNTVEQRILDALYDRIGLFEETIGAMEPILGDIEREIANLLLRDVQDLDKAIELYEKTLSEKVSEAREIQRKLGDFALDTRLFQMERLEALLGRKPRITSDMLRRFVINFVTRAGGVVTDAYGDVTTIRIPRGIALSRAGSRNLKGTFDLDFARANENVEFIAFGHPFIEDCLDAAIGELSVPSVSVLDLSDGADTSGVLFVYQVEMTDLRNTRKLVPVFIGNDLCHSRKESERVFERLLFGQRPSPAIPDAGIDIARHSEAAEAVVQGMAGSMMDGIRAANRERIDREKARLDRLHTFKERKLTDQIARDNLRLRKMQASGEEKYRKIIPAIMGRMEKARRELDSLDGEKAVRMAELDARQDFGEKHSVVGAAIVGG